jgi:hypothetical protein
VNDFGRIGFLAVVGTLFTVFGAAIGLYNWILAASKGVPSTTGTVMIASCRSFSEFR